MSMLALGTYIAMEEGDEHVNFTCGDDNRYGRFKNQYELSYFGTINFDRCQFRELESKFVLDFPYLHTLNVSNVALEKLHVQSLRDGKNLRTVIASNNRSNNRLTEVSSHLFVNIRKYIKHPILYIFIST